MKRHASERRRPAKTAERRLPGVDTSDRNRPLRVELRVRQHRCRWEDEGSFRHSRCANLTLVLIVRISGIIQFGVLTPVLAPIAVAMLGCGVVEPPVAATSPAASNVPVVGSATNIPGELVVDTCFRLPPPDAEDEPCERLPVPENPVPENNVQPTSVVVQTKPPVEQTPPPVAGPALAPPAEAPAESPPPEALPAQEMAGNSPWWDQRVSQSLRADAKPWQIDLDSLLLVALTRSDHVLAVSLEPQIRETEINRQLAQFDSTSFLESKWNDLNDPVGNTLTTGGPSRYLDRDWQNRGGVRRKNWLGGQVELAQEMGLRNTNSVYFVPGNQANTRMVLSYTQPLMRGAGQCYNESVIVLARTDVELARHELEGQLQDHFLSVAEGYWKLWLERARLLQRRDAVTRSASLLRELENRREIDVLQSHILRARGALAVHGAAAKRAELSVRNQETRLWALTGAPELHTKSGSELIPQVLPDLDLPVPDRDASVQQAVTQRPEVTATIQRIRAAETRTQVAVHELKPLLNLALQAYGHGLDGQFNVGQAFVNQFATGAPGYTAGLVYEVPLGNAAAEARLRRRRLETKQLALELEATLKSVAADVDNILRDIEAAKATADGQFQAMQAARAEMDYVLGRWRMLPGEDRATSLMLDEALDALDRLVNAEGALAQAQAEFALTLIQYKRATGQLFQVEPVRDEPKEEVLVGRRTADQGQAQMPRPAAPRR